MVTMRTARIQDIQPLENDLQIKVQENPRLNSIMVPSQQVPFQKKKLSVCAFEVAFNMVLCKKNQEGVGDLWTGIGPNIARNAIINAAELASYDKVKQTLLKIPGFNDNVVTHLFAGTGAGFFAVCIGSPVDVAKKFVKSIESR